MKQVTISKIEHGPTPQDTRIFLSDGSELIGLKRVFTCSAVDDSTEVELKAIVMQEPIQLMPSRLHHQDEPGKTTIKVVGDVVGEEEFVEHTADAVSQALKDTPPQHPTKEELNPSAFTIHVNGKLIPCTDTTELKGADIMSAALYSQKQIESGEYLIAVEYDEENGIDDFYAGANDMIKIFPDTCLTIFQPAEANNEEEAELNNCPRCGYVAADSFDFSKEDCPSCAVIDKEQMSEEEIKQMLISEGHSEKCASTMASSWYADVQYGCSCEEASK
jgi:hypothetical protein